MELKAIEGIIAHLAGILLTPNPFNGIESDLQD
jgi:hypothetical protein